MLMCRDSVPSICVSQREVELDEAERSSHTVVCCLMLIFDFDEVADQAALHREHDVRVDVGTLAHEHVCGDRLVAVGFGDEVKVRRSIRGPACLDHQTTGRPSVGIG